MRIDRLDGIRFGRGGAGDAVWQPHEEDCPTCVLDRGAGNENTLRSVPLYSMGNGSQGANDVAEM
jgi:hypothetical protein